MAVTGNMKYYSIRDLEDQLGRTKLNHFIRDNEVGMLQDIAEIAYQAAWDPKIKAVFVSGPTSSGKTTFTRRLAAALNMHGRPTLQLSLDDYYRDAYKPNFIDGRPDYESLYTMDLELFHQNFSQLIAGREAWIPSFNFVTTRREFHEYKRVRMLPRSILLVEGLHGLSEAVSGQVSPSAHIGVMIMPWAGIASDRRLLGPRDIRIFRRMSRDVMHRGTSALATLDYWPMIDLTEGQFFPDYLARADYFVNSALAYEFMVIPHLAAHRLGEDMERIQAGHMLENMRFLKGNQLIDHERTLEEGRRLLEAAAALPVISADNIPEHSILNEFIH